MPVMVKASRSGFGLGVYSCADHVDAEAAARTIAGPYQVQEFLTDCAFVNVQYRGSEHLATTDQILDGFCHSGSRYPSSFDPRSMTDAVAAGLVEAGLGDVFALDVAAVPHEGGTNFLLLEANPRFNASTYATLAARRIGAQRWVAISVPTRFRHLEPVLDMLDDALYTPECGAGILIVNWGTVLTGQLLVLVIGNPDDEVTLRERLTALH
jgi:hypothetical protein